MGRVHSFLAAKPLPLPAKPSLSAKLVCRPVKFSVGLTSLLLLPLVSYSPALAQSGAATLELVSSPNTGSARQGSNFVVIASETRQEAAASGGFRGSATLTALDGSTATNHTSLADVLTTDPVRLKNIAVAQNLPMIPVYALVSQSAAKKQMRVVGVRDKNVWIAHGQAPHRQLQRLGRVVEKDDARLREYENSVVGARLVLAYETPSRSAGDGKGDLTAVLISQRTFYAVKKLGSSSYAIDQLGVLGDDK